MPDSLKQEDSQETHPSLSTGTGIAIAGIWIAGAGLTALLSMEVFMWSPPSPDDLQNADPTSAFFVICVMIAIVAAPMIAAFAATKMVLGKD